MILSTPNNQFLKYFFSAQSALYNELNSRSNRLFAHNTQNTYSLSIKVQFSENRKSERRMPGNRVVVNSDPSLSVVSVCMCLSVWGEGVGLAASVPSHPSSSLFSVCRGTVLLHLLEDEKTVKLR